MEASRLDAFAPDVAIALRMASSEARGRAAEFAIGWAVAQTGLTHTAVESGTADEIASLVTELDERYFALTLERDAGRANTEQVVAAFERARAASAAELVRRGELAEAVYEAAAAAGDWSELRAGLLDRLKF